MADRDLPAPPRIRSPAELVMELIENASGGWLHKTKVVERADMAPGPGSLYVELMIQHGWLEAHRDGRITHVRATEAGKALAADGRAFFAEIYSFLEDLAAARR